MSTENNNTIWLSFTASDLLEHGFQLSEDEKYYYYKADSCAYLSLTVIIWVDTGRVELRAEETLPVGRIPFFEDPSTLKIRLNELEMNAISVNLQIRDAVMSNTAGDDHQTQDNED